MPSLPSLSSTTIFTYIPIPKEADAKTNLVTLVVGGPHSPSREPCPTKFIIPTALLTSCSPFFATCLADNNYGVPSACFDDLALRETKRRWLGANVNNNEHWQEGYKASRPTWKEGRTHIIHMPTERAEDVRILVGWLRSQQAGWRMADGYKSWEGDDDSGGNVSGIRELTDWKEACRAFPGLYCKSIDRSVEEYLNWKIEKQTSIGEGRIDKNRSHERETENIQRKKVHHRIARNFIVTTADCPVRLEADFSGNDCTSEVSGNTDTDFIGNDTEQLSENSTTTSTSRDTLHLKSNSLTAPRRPSPPVLGPLVRLYILADKYNITHPSTSYSTSSCLTTPLTPSALLDLRRQITLNLTTIHNLTHTVPHREDITRLWESVSVDILGKEGLKEAIVNIFVGLRGREIERLFGDSSKCGDHELRGGDLGDGEVWDADFLRRVLIGRAQRGR